MSSETARARKSGGRGIKKSSIFPRILDRGWEVSQPYLDMRRPKVIL
jgi:hypothetical protein